MVIAVVGSGGVGLALATQYALRVAPVTVVDHGDAFERARETLHREPDLASRVRHCEDAGTLSMSSDLEAAVSQARAILVFTPVQIADKHACYKALEEVSYRIGKSMSSGALVSYEMRLPPGTTQNRLLPVLVSDTGRRAGRDFALAVSAPRETPGHIFADLDRFPKIVGAFDEDSAALAREFYSRSVQSPLLVFARLEVAEFIGMAEALGREVGSAFSHELADIARRAGLDFRQMQFLINTQPWFQVQAAGLHTLDDACQVAAQMALEQHSSPVVAAARAVNDALPRQISTRIEASLGGLKDQELALVVDADDAWCSRRAEAMRDALLASGARLRMHTITDAKAPWPHDECRARVLVVATDRVSLACLDRSAIRNCEVLVDTTERFSADAVAALGLRFLSLSLDPRMPQ